MWEAIVLAERGRIRVELPVHEWVERMVRSIPRREAPLTHDIAIMSRRLALPHQDPADRFLAATARVLGLTLVTADERLLHASEFATMANA
ncbi:MAG: type II toxin-antitoxin system VapC family toxin [Gemmatimonadaceae bacterium]